MATSKCSAPADISEKNVSGTCDLKCDYHFMYATAMSTVKHEESYLEMSYTETTPSVFFNSEGYKVDASRLYCPSLHSYDGSNADAELIIVHSSLSGAQTLMVCVPVRAATVAKSALDGVVEAAVGGAARVGETATVGALRLTGLIPHGVPLYSYTGTTPWLPCEQTTVNYVVFRDSPAPISAASLAALQKLVRPSSVQPLAVPLFVNKKGAQPGGGGGMAEGGGDLTFDCQPVSSSDASGDASGGGGGGGGESKGGGGKGGGMSSETQKKLVVAAMVVAGFLIFLGLCYWASRNTQGAQGTPAVAMSKKTAVATKTPVSNKLWETDDDL